MRCKYPLYNSVYINYFYMVMSYYGSPAYLGFEAIRFTQSL